MGWFEDRGGLADRVAIVTGGAGGLGEAVTTDLVANGVKVAALDIDGDAVEALRQRLDAQDAEAVVVQGDARDPEVLESLFATVDDRWGQLDTLVNVPGGTFRANFEDTRPKGWDTLLRMNLTHVLHACSLAIPRMKAGGRGGSIVNMTTIEAHRAAPGFAVYSAAKAGVAEFTRTLAVEVGPYGIRVNCVAPDITPTPNMIALAGGEITGTGARDNGPSIAIPMGRVGVPTDISSAVVFLASDLSRYITGTTIHADGGTYASSGWFNWPGTGWQNSPPESVLDFLASGGSSDS